MTIINILLQIISDIGQLKFLANMHESIEDFCNTIRELLSELGPAVLAKLKTTAIKRKSQASSSNVTADSADSSSEGSQLMNSGAPVSTNAVPKTTIADEFEVRTDVLTCVR